MEHIVLVGDSILDNKAYTGSGPCVTEHLEFKLLERAGWEVTNCAVDGDVVQDVIETQLDTIPDTATVLVVSAGGNDGLQLLCTLQQEGLTPCNFVRKLHQIRNAFRVRYAGMLQELLKLDRPMMVCTIYHPRFEQEGFLEKAVAHIGVFFLNRVIRSEARKSGLPIIDLAWVFNDANDYANAIEPSSWGGDKITNNIMKVLSDHEFDSKRSATYSCRAYSAVQTPGMATADRRDAHRLAKAAKNERYRN